MQSILSNRNVFFLYFVSNLLATSFFASIWKITLFVYRFKKKSEEKIHFRGSENVWEKGERGCWKEAFYRIKSQYKWIFSYNKDLFIYFNKYGIKGGIYVFNFVAFSFLRLYWYRYPFTFIHPVIIIIVWAAVLL